jgi:flagellar biosynthesis protein FliR
MDQALPLGDSSELLTGVLGAAMRTGLRIAAPVIVANLLLNAALGAIGRLVPSLQVLFVATPLQVMLVLGIVMLSLATGLHAFLQLFGGTLGALAG